MTVGELQTLLREGGMGFASAMTVFVVGLVRAWWVMGREYQAMRQDRDEWREMALTGQVVARRSLGFAKRAEVETVEP